MGAKPKKNGSISYAKWGYIFIAPFFLIFAVQAKLLRQPFDMVRKFMGQRGVEFQSLGRVSMVYINDIIVGISQRSGQIKGRCTIGFQTGDHIFDSDGGNGTADRKVIFHTSL